MKKYYWIGDSLSSILLFWGIVGDILPGLTINRHIQTDNVEKIEAQTFNMNGNAAITSQRKGSVELKSNQK